MKGARLSTAALAYIAGACVLAVTVAVMRWRSETPGNLVLFVVITGLGMLAHAHPVRSEEHTSELQSRLHLVCRLLLEKKKNPGKQSPRLHLKRTRRHQLR